MFKCLTLILVIVAAMATTLHSQDVFEYRGVPLGATKETVKSSVTLRKLSESPDGIVYGDLISGLNCNIFYGFNGNELYRVGIVFTEQHMVRNKHVQNYRDIGKALREKYGVPVRDETLWHDDLFKNRPDQLGLAVASEHAVLVTQWSVQGALIQHGLTASGGAMQHVVMFTDADREPAKEDPKDKL